MSTGIGENIRRIRREKKITQKKLAEMTGLTNVVINYYEHGAKNGQMSINDGKIAVSFRKLDLKAFYDRYQEYLREEAEAEKEADPGKQAEMKKAARSSFEEWMDAYRVEND